MNDDEIIAILNEALDEAISHTAWRLGFNEQINETIRKRIIRQAFEGINPSWRQGKPISLKKYYKKVFCSCFKYDLSRQSENN